MSSANSISIRADQGLTSLKGIEKLTNLKSVAIMRCPNLKNVDLTQNTALETIRIQESGLSTIKVSD